MRSTQLALGKSVRVALLALAACGGQVDEGTSRDAAPTVPPGMIDPPASRTNAGGPEQVASDVGVPSAIAVTTDAVVFTTSATRLGGELVQAGALFVADKRTGPALMLHVDPQGASFDALTVSGDRAFVATSDGRLLAVPVAGGSVSEVATLPAPAEVVTATAEHVYAAAADGAIVRVARTGGEVEALGTVSGSVRGIVADGSAVFAAVTKAEGRGAIEKIDLASHEVSSLADDVPAPCAMAREGERLFWTSTGGVLALTTTGGAPKAIAEGFAACAIATDGASLFFATRAAAAEPTEAPRTRGGQAGLGLMRAPTSGGVATPIAGATSALVQPGAVATDAAHLYWLTESGVLRVRK